VPELKKLLLKQQALIRKLMMVCANIGRQMFKKSFTGFKDVANDELDKASADKTIPHYKAKDINNF
jgi:hypothetical protein